jgi:hypothetical protein
MTHGNVALGVFLVAVTCAPAQSQGLTVRSGDGVALELTNRGEVTRFAIGDVLLPLKGRGGFGITDYGEPSAAAGKPVHVPVEAKAEQRGEAVALRGGLPRAGLELEATLTGDKECIRIDGTVRDTTGKDRAVAVEFRLPLDAMGWTWHLDSEERQTIVAAETYRHTYRCEAGTGDCSIYPWSALSGREVGLTLALPLAQGPRVFVVQHDQAVPATSVTFYFGLATSRWPWPTFCGTSRKNAGGR